eukprot:CAMPEP_0172377224 /NCGR_PEP_ID=MMETSP1060-20121228/68789_1 /TAXON_ID=37318 /ORGANISM="Pseudo-nitzschia pungens, Strain cf. cingulata" /LENGTH=139 /DNA_ID=CAMNT_0013104897 /DNA_START=69 /DNA_END=488 /DNA_ORIENTATION=-
MISARSLSLLLLCLSGSAATNSLRVEFDDAVSGRVEERLAATKSLFLSWLETQAKDYTTDEEKMQRHKIWMENHERIESHNTQIPAPKFTFVPFLARDPSQGLHDGRGKDATTQDLDGKPRYVLRELSLRDAQDEGIIR